MGWFAPKHLPEGCPELIDSQEDQSAIDDESFKRSYTWPPVSKMDRLLQILQFIFLLGWLRVIIFFVLVVMGAIVNLPLWWRPGGPVSLWWCKRVSEPWHQYIWIRGVAFCLGVWRLRIHGEIDPKARVLIHNHLSMLDGPLVWTCKIFTVVMLAGVKRMPIVGSCFIGARTVFIDRSQGPSGRAGLLGDIVRDRTRHPICVAPEGKVTNGEFLYAFRTGAFLEEARTQPIAVKYTYWAWGRAQVGCVAPYLEWLWGAFCVPFGIVDIYPLKSFKKAEMRGKDPQERAKMVQLRMANALGVRAINRTSHAIFLARRQQAGAKAE